MSASLAFWRQYTGTREARWDVATADFENSCRIAKPSTTDEKAHQLVFAEEILETILVPRLQSHVVRLCIPDTEA
jgi:hypothetical protein